MNNCLTISDLSRHKHNDSIFKKQYNIYNVLYRISTFKSMAQFSCYYLVDNEYPYICDMTNKHVFPLSLIMAFHRRSIFSINCDTFFKATENFTSMKDFIEKDKYQRIYRFDYGEDGRYIDFD